VWSIGSLIGFRVLQGLGGGMILPVGQLAGLEPGKGCVDDVNAQDGLPGARQLRAIPAHAPSCAPGGLLAARQHSHRTSPGLHRLVRPADQAGVDTVRVVDHLLQADPNAAPDQRDVLKAYTTLGYLAAHTERVRLGTMVTGVTFRPPALLVKAVTTLDVLTGGRAWLGTGAGYHGEEAQAMGLPLPAVAERFERLEETLQIAARMWAGDQAPVTEQEVLDLVQRWAEVELRGDADAYGDLFAPDFVGVGPVGFVLTREHWADRRRGDRNNEEFQAQDPHVRI